MSTKKKNADYLKQGGILAMASLIVRIIGMVYRIPMSNILGEEGNGIYAVAFEIYDLILIISSYSLPLALSKMISARQANREHKNTESCPAFCHNLRRRICFDLVFWGRCD